MVQRYTWGAAGELLRGMEVGERKVQSRGAAFLTKASKAYANQQQAHMASDRPALNLSRRPAFGSREESQEGDRTEQGEHLFTK